MKLVPLFDFLPNEMRSLEDTKPALLELLEDNPDHLAAHFAVARVYSRNGEWLNAIKHFREALQIDPYNTDARDRLDRAIKNNEQYLIYDSSAVEHLKQSVLDLKQKLRINPNDLNARFDYAWYLGALGEKRKAIQEFTEVLRLKPNDVRTHLTLGHMLAKDGLIREAIYEYSKAVAGNSQDGAAHLFLGTMFLKVRQFEAAIKECELALQYNYMDPTVVVNTWAYALGRQGKYEDAIATFLYADSLHPNHLEVLLGLGMAYQTLNQVDLAKSVYLKALKWEPDLLEAEHYLEMLNTDCI